MPSASKIRREILQAINDSILPLFRQQKPTQLVAFPPYNLNELEHWTEKTGALPTGNAQPYQLTRHWSHERMIALSDPLIRLIYEGVSYERLGITDEQIDKYRIQDPGITCVQIPAPGIVYYGENTPHADGSIRSDVWNGLTKGLLIKPMGNNILVSHYQRSPHSVYASFSLEIHDPLLVQMAKIYFDELKADPYGEGTQALILALIHRLRRHLLQTNPKISHSTWVEFDKTQAVSAGQFKNDLLINRSIEFMQQNLHRPLQLKDIAGEMGLSVSQANRLFCQHQGKTVMNYFAVLRIETAKQLLKFTHEQVGDIAQLTGFSSHAGFCNSFKRLTGTTPNQFRHLFHDVQNEQTKQ